MISRQQHALVVSLGHAEIQNYHIYSVMRWGFPFKTNLKDLDPSYKMDVNPELQIRGGTQEKKINKYLGFTALSRVLHIYQADC